MAAFSAGKDEVGCRWCQQCFIISGLPLLQGHVLFTRQAGGMLPCPLVDFTGGFNGFLAAAYGVSSVQAAFGAPFSVSSACLHMR